MQRNINQESLLYLSTTEILNMIGEMYGNSILTKMLDFCETYDIDEQYLGDILEEDKNFKDMFHDELASHNQVKDEAINLRQDKLEGLSVWV